MSRTEYAYTTGTVGTAVDTVTYTYGNSDWGDLLTSYDGKAITYDGIGNPLSDGTWTYSWKSGRELATMSNGTTVWSYTYDSNGMRTIRTNGTTTYQYVYNGSQLTQLTVGNSTLHFAYSGNRPITVLYNDYVYYYITNIQGDVIAILDEDGTAVVTYTYDAWGTLLSNGGTMATTLGQLNPLRYRGYVWDSETNLYYLQSRYYDPEVGRFLNADAFVSTGQGFAGNNMFAYCGNNPVCYYDPTGHYSHVYEDRTDGDAYDGILDAGGGGGHSAADGTGSMIGDIVYISNKDTGLWNSYSSILDWLTSTLFRNQKNTTDTSSTSTSNKVQHTKGTTSPRTMINPNGSHTQIGSNGKIYSYTTFNSNGNQQMRIDFQGKPHRGVLPHIHCYVYLPLGGRKEFIYDLSWKQLK